MQNSLYPGFVKLFYSSNGHNHVQVIPCKPFLSVSSTWFVEHKNGGVGELWTAAVNAYVVVLKALLHSGSTIQFADLYTMADETADPLFRETHNITVAGTSGTTAIALAQLNVSYRSQEGGRANVRIMEPGIALAVNSATLPPFTASASLAALHTYLVGATSWFCARDGGFLNAAVRALIKTNDDLRKEFVLNV